jgi:hypothetical protein
MGISRHLLDENWAVREKKEAGSTLALPGTLNPKPFAYLMSSKTFVGTGVI